MPTHDARQHRPPCNLMFIAVAGHPIAAVVASLGAVSAKGPFLD